MDRELPPLDFPSSANGRAGKRPRVPSIQTAGLPMGPRPSFRQSSICQRNSPKAVHLQFLKLCDPARLDPKRAATRRFLEKSKHSWGETFLTQLVCKVRAVEERRIALLKICEHLSNSPYDERGLHRTEHQPHPGRNRNLLVALAVPVARSQPTSLHAKLHRRLCLQSASGNDSATDSPRR